MVGTALLGDTIAVNQPDLLAVSEAIEALLAANNHRGMNDVRASLTPGYLLRAAQAIHACSGRVYILTGFPVAKTFETDGPAGAMALYRLCQRLQKDPVILSEPDVTAALSRQCRCHALSPGTHKQAQQAAAALYKTDPPALVISIECPGAAADGHYYNMAGEDISKRCIRAEPYLEQANCSTIAIGDGGNEVGMGNVAQSLMGLDIRPAECVCSELIVADVSNWAAYALCALTDWLDDRTMSAIVDIQSDLEHLVRNGAVDGVTGASTATEDGFPEHAAEKVMQAIHAILLQGKIQ